MDQAQAQASPELKAVAQFLRSNKSGLKHKTGALGGKRVDYFKGKSAIKALQSPAYSKLKHVPSITSSDEATDVLTRLNQHAFFLRINRAHHHGSSNKDAPKPVQIIPEQLFTSEEYYVWFMDATTPLTQLALAVGLVVVVLAAVMFPLWPTKLRVGVWYLSIVVLGLIGLFFVMAIIRLIVWLITIVLLRPGIWIFPNLFADVGFVDSFIPLWSWDVEPPKKSKKDKRDKKQHKSNKKDKNSSSTNNDNVDDESKLVELQNEQES
ncbi:Translocation protein S62 [Microbotryomycetes sp. JL221]|nr:Translocation protein S62 [Microbotryomycetes sp. JL221]